MMVRILLASVLALTLSHPLLAQPALTWANNAAANWGDASSYVQNSAPTTSTGILFPSTTAVNNPVFAASNVASFLTIVNSGANVYNFSPSTISTLNLSSTSTTQGTAATNNTAAITLLGGGTTTFDTNLTTSFVGAAFVYSSGGSILDFAGTVTAPAGSQTSFRVDNSATSAIRFRGTNNFANNNTISLGNSTGTTAGRYEFGVDSALGSGTLNTGGSGGAFTLIALDPSGTNGITRILTNGTQSGGSVNLGLNMTFGDAATATNSLRFTGNTFFGAGRTYTVSISSSATNPLLSTSSLQFTGNTQLLASSGAANGTVLFQGTGRVDISGVLANGGTGAFAGSLNVGTGNGLTTVRLSNPNNTYTGTTNLQSGSLVLAADAPASGTGVLGNSSSVVTIGTATGTINRFLVLDVTSNAVNMARPITVLSGSAATPPVTVFGTTISAGGTASNTGTLASTVTLGTSSGSQALPLVFTANTLQAGQSSTLNVAGTLTRNSGFTGDINVTINSNLGVNGFVGAGTVKMGATTTGLNASTTVTAGTLEVTSGSTYESGRGVTISDSSLSNGTLRLNGTLTAGTGTLTVNNTGVLTGNGASNLPVTVTSGGTFTPGLTTPDTFTANNGVTLQTGSTWRVQLAGAAGTSIVADPTSTGLSGTPGLVNGRVQAGSSAISMQSNVNMILDVTGITGNLDLNQNYSFRIAQTTGTNTVTNPSGFVFLSNGADVTSNFTNANLALFTSGPDNFTILNFTPVPEPMTILAVAGLGLFTWNRRKKFASFSA